jgi:lipoprotein-anchoring transpeptidase ErfK/SrfK
MRILPACTALLAVLLALAMAGQPAHAAKGIKTAHGELARKVVPFPNDYGAGAIIIRTSEKRLYYTINDRQAIRYAVAVGKAGAQWSGITYVSTKVRNPSWRPTANMRRKNPRLPTYMAPGPRNPLGVRALYLDWGAYRIHGTNAPGSIGRAASSGCIRMNNGDVTDLFERVHVGAPVYVEK